MSTTSSARLIWITPDAEKTVGYCARVSNPSNQENENVTGLLRYCVKHGHWSVFEMANMCVEIHTTRDISAQLIRHRSFSFQEFSQRYAEATEIGWTPIRRQDLKNRQNSIDDLGNHIQMEWMIRHDQLIDEITELYSWALEQGVAKECARRILPLSTKTKLYMNGSIRSWIHYFNLRCDPATQLEHRVIACAIRDIFREQLPIIGELI